MKIGKVTFGRVGMYLILPRWRGKNQMMVGNRVPSSVVGLGREGDNARG